MKAQLSLFVSILAFTACGHGGSDDAAKTPEATPAPAPAPELTSAPAPAPAPANVPASQPAPVGPQSVLIEDFKYKVANTFCTTGTINDVKAIKTQCIPGSISISYSNGGYPSYFMFCCSVL